MALEGSRSLGKAKGHNPVFELPISVAQGGFTLFFLLDSNKLISSMEVKLGEDPPVLLLV